MRDIIHGFLDNYKVLSAYSVPGALNLPTTLTIVFENQHQSRDTKEHGWLYRDYMGQS